MDRLEIVKGLNSLNIVESWPDKREFYVQGATASEYQRIVAEAAAALRPRVLALEEIPEWDRAVYIENRVSGNVNLTIYRYESMPWMWFFSVVGTAKYKEEDYGVYWRCWTRRPTEQEAALEPWTVAEDGE